MWPVLQRELREQARQVTTYWLRVIAAGVAMLLFWLAWEQEANGGALNGRGYFLGLHRLMFLGIWFFGPVLTADCLSRERREGTLGLLFLTPLRPVDVVVGKAFIHALRGLAFVLAAIPIMVVPVLLGGVTWYDAVRMILLQLAALGLALVAGLTASALTESWWRARLLAFLFALLAAGLFVTLHAGIQVILQGWNPFVASPLDSFGQQFSVVFGQTLARQGGLVEMGFSGFWQDWSLGPIGPGSVRVALVVLASAWTLVGIVVWLAALGVQRTWRQEPLSARGETIHRWFTEVRLGRTWWRRRRGSILSANPIHWLQSRTWAARLGGWALLGVALALAATVVDLPRSSAEGFYFLGRTILLGSVAFAGAASFRQERESGALELWLVTPLKPSTVVNGRLAGLAKRFLVPTLIVLFLPQIRFLWRWYLLPQLPEAMRPTYLVFPPVDWMWAGWVAATVVFGVGLSLSRLSFLTTFALAWVAHHTPFVVTAVLDWANDEAMERFQRGFPGWESNWFFTRFSLALALAVTAWGLWFARRQLAERRYLAGWSSADLSRSRKLREVRAA